MAAFMRPREEDDSTTPTILQPEPRHVTKSLQFKKVFTELAEEVKCALCLEFFDKPLLLPCLHTFCAPCLKELASEGSILCPLCRHQHALDDKGIEGLKINYHLLNIAEKMRSASMKRCDECQLAFVTEHCRECRAYLCTPCGAKIHSLRLMRVHVRRPVDPSDAIMLDEMLNADIDELRISSRSPSPVPPSPSSSPLPFDSGGGNGVIQGDDIIVDFTIKRDKCLENFRRWERGLWFAPFDLKRASQIRQVKPLLVPYWLFEAEATSVYTASTSVMCISPATGVVGKDTHWLPVSGSVNGRYRYAVCASDSLDRTILSKVEPFELENLRPPAPPLNTNTTTTITHNNPHHHPPHSQSQSQSHSHASHPLSHGHSTSSSSSSSASTTFAVRRSSTAGLSPRNATTPSTSSSSAHTLLSTTPFVDVPSPLIGPATQSQAHNNTHHLITQLSDRDNTSDDDNHEHEHEHEGQDGIHDAGSSSSHTTRGSSSNTSSSAHSSASSQSSMIVHLGGIPRAQALACTVDSMMAYQKGNGLEDSEGVEPKIDRMARDNVSRSIRDKAGPMHTIHDIRQKTVITRVAAQRVFMPLWWIKYIYGGQVYIVMVNGQTGQLFGERPYSVGKVASLSLTGLGAIVGFFASKNG